MAVHVSIHDVSPPFWNEVRDALELCAEQAIRPALLVVPDFHGQAPLERHPEFCAWVREQQEAGHEIYLHGFSHEARPAPPVAADTKTWWSWYFRQRVVSAGEAEFADLSREEAEQRLNEGLALFDRCGFRVDGFVPPAWSMPDWALELLAARDIAYTERHLRIHQPNRGKTRRSLVINWATRTLGRKLSTVAFCRVARPAIGRVPTRIAIHPADVRSSLVRREIQLLLRAVRHLPTTTGPGLFDT